MSTTAIVVVVVIGALIVVAIGVFFAVQAHRRNQLKGRFGPEYDRTLEASGSKKEGEAKLRDRVAQRDQLVIRQLSPEQRDRYGQEWQRVQAEFVDAPARSVIRADLLITDVMSERGYPMEDFEAQTNLISVDQPEVVEEYRKAHAIYVSSQNGTATTEDLREAFVSYRALFERLVGEGVQGSDTVPSASA